MISLNPAVRPSFDMLLASARGTILPECFYSFLHEYVASVGERPSTFPFPSLSHSVSNAIPSTHVSTATPSTAIKVPSKEAVATGTSGNGNDSVLPSDSDHRLERIWEGYENVDPYLTDDTDVDRTVMDVKVEFGNNIVGPSKPLQVYFITVVTLTVLYRSCRMSFPSPCIFLLIPQVVIQLLLKMVPHSYFCRLFLPTSAIAFSLRLASVL